MQNDSDVGMADYMAAIKRRRFLALITALPVALVGLVVAFALPDVYSSAATFRLVTERIADLKDDNVQYVDQYVFGLADKVLTSETLRAIIADFDPYPEADQSDPDEMTRRLRADTTVTMVTQTVLQGLREQSINVGFRVAHDNRLPEKAEQVATRLADAFIETGRADQLQIATSKVNFFSGEANRLRSQIGELERQLSDFKSANFDRLPESAQANVAIRGRLEQELDGLEREVRTLQQNRVFASQQLRQAEAGPGGGNLRLLEEEYARKAAVYAPGHPDLVSLRRQIDLLRQGGGAVRGGTPLQQQLDQERASLAESRQRYSDDHPDIRRLVRSIETLQARMAAGEDSGGAGPSETLATLQLQTQLNAINTQIGGLQGRAGTLRSRLAELDRQLGATPEVEREYQEITRGLGSARDQFNQMMTRQLEAELEVAAINSGAADRFVLASPPSTPWGPAGPPRLGIVVISLVLSTLLALTAIVLAEVMDATVRGARDVRSILHLSPLATVPYIENSVRRAGRMRRLAVTAGSVLVVAPVIYLIVHALTV